MKIAVIAHAHYPIAEPFVGGLETHTYHMVNELVRLGHDVTIFAKHGTTTNAKVKTIFKGRAFDGRNPFLLQGYRYAMRLIMAGQYDYIINNSLSNVPIEMHNAAMAPMLTIFHTPPIEPLANSVAHSPILPNPAYAAVSEFTADQWQEHTSEVIQVVANGMDLSEWSINTNAPAQPMAAWVGRITPEKGTHLAIDACIAAGIPLQFGGNIYNKKYFKNHIKPRLEHPLVQYVGHLNHQSVNDLFKKASVALVTPLWDEPFGLVEIEAWASGTPVAAFANGALKSLVQPEVGCLASDESADALQQSLQQAMRLPRNVCRRYVEERFSLTAMVRSYLALMPEPSNSEYETVQWLAA